MPGRGGGYFKSGGLVASDPNGSPATNDAAKGDEERVVGMAAVLKFDNKTRDHQRKRSLPEVAENTWPACMKGKL